MRLITYRLSITHNQWPEHWLTDLAKLVSSTPKLGVLIAINSSTMNIISLLYFLGFFSFISLLLNMWTLTINRYWSHQRNMSKVTYIKTSYFFLEMNKRKFNAQRKKKRFCRRRQTYVFFYSSRQKNQPEFP